MEIIISRHYPINIPIPFFSVHHSYRIFPILYQYPLCRLHQISHSQFCSSWSVLYLFFSNVLMASLSYYFYQLPVVFSFHFSSPIFPIRCQLLNSYHLHQLFHFQLSSWLGWDSQWRTSAAKTPLRIPPLFSASLFPVCLRTCVLYFTRFMYNNCQIPNFLLACFYFSNFHRSFPLSWNFHTISHHSAFSSKCSLPQISLSISSSASLISVSSFFSSECHVPPSLSRRRVSPAVLFLALGSARWRHLIGGTQHHSIKAGACFRRPKFTGFCEAFLKGK